MKDKAEANRRIPKPKRSGRRIPWTTDELAEMHRLHALKLSWQEIVDGVNKKYGRHRTVQALHTKMWKKSVE